MPNLLDFSNLNALPKPWIPFNRTCSTSCPANYEDVCYNGTKTCKKCENGKYRKLHKLKKSVFGPWLFI